MVSLHAVRAPGMRCAVLWNLSCGVGVGRWRT